MHLHQICSATHVAVFIDYDNQWLYIEWRGELTLSAVKQACLEIAHCFLEHVYPRVLNSNTQVTRIDWDVAPWLTQNLFPGLGLAGVEQLAWVYAPSISGQFAAQLTVNSFPTLNIALFADEEQAVTWLQHNNPTHFATGCAAPLRPEPAEQKLTRAVNRLTKEVHSLPAGTI